MAADEPGYAFVNAAPAQRQRLESLEAWLDDGTIRILDARGLEPGRRCLEAGAGGGSIAAWLCGRVGPDGSVLATDLDVRFLRELRYPNLELRVHDLLEDDLPEGEFDLVHVRLVLSWLAEPDVALRRLVSALKPGGCLVAEELDFQSLAVAPGLDTRTRSLFSRVAEAHLAILSAQHGFDPFYGRRIAGDLSAAGLADVQAEGRTSMWRGGGPGGRMLKLTLLQLREAIVMAGLAAPADVDEIIKLCDQPRLSLVSPVTMGAWGHRPHPQPASTLDATGRLP
jgi:SAM-dependent methyltransferase